MRFKVQLLPLLLLAGLVWQGGLGLLGTGPCGLPVFHSHALLGAADAHDLQIHLSAEAACTLEQAAIEAAHHAAEAHHHDETEAALVLSFVVNDGHQSKLLSSLTLVALAALVFFVDLVGALFIWNALYNWRGNSLRLPPPTPPPELLTK